MPSAVRKVEFSPTPVYSRQPRDDEDYVMMSFARHAERCSQCAHPYDTYLDRESLCEKGIAKAKDVAQYLYSSKGRAYSTVDRQGAESMHIEIPRGCEAVRELLKAIEKGMQIYARPKPIVSYDPTYFVPARPAQKIITPEPQYVTIEPANRQRKEKVYIPGRGSLYKSDMAERRRNREEEIVYYEMKPRGARGSTRHHR